MDKTHLSLLALLQAANEAGWDAFVEGYSAVIVRWMKGCGVEDQEDVKQEVFLAVFRSIKKFDRRRDGSFRSWLRKIVNNRVLASLKKKRNCALRPIDHECLEQLAVDGTTSSRIWDEEHESYLLRHAVERVRAELNDSKGFQAFLAVAVEGKAAAEVAAALGVTVAYVYLAKHRVKGLLKEQLAQYLD